METVTNSDYDFGPLPQLGTGETFDAVFCEYRAEQSKFKPGNEYLRLGFDVFDGRGGTDRLSIICDAKSKRLNQVCCALAGSTSASGSLRGLLHKKCRVRLGTAKNPSVKGLVIVEVLPVTA
jgi:hypothetical protein